MSQQMRAWKCVHSGAMVCAVLIVPSIVLAQSATQPITVQLPSMEGPEQVVPALKILLMFTVLALAPAILISMTSFTRIVVVMSFIRQAIGAQSVPPMQVVLSLSLLFTGVVMAPTASRLNKEALEPYMAKQIKESEAFDSAKHVISDFLIKQTREADLRLFYEMTDTALPTTAEEVSLHLLVPAFMISELRTGFEMGFLVFLPFILVDLVVASILTAMGMVMLPPTMLSTPMKILLFVLVDGWSLLTQSIISSFA